MAYEIDEIRDIILDGPKRFEYVETDAAMYAIQRDNWRYKYRIELPKFENAILFGNVLDLRILCTTVNIFIKFKNTFWIDFSFKPGFVTDLASVPWFLRGIVDNDTHNALPAVLIHDFLFATHRLPFRIANSLFYKMLRANGYPAFRSLLAFWAVKSCVGRNHWNDISIDRSTWASRTAAMRLARPIEYDGREYK